MHLNYINNTDGKRNPVIVLPTCKRINVILVHQIIRIQSLSNYSKLYFYSPSERPGGAGETLVVAKGLRCFHM